MNDTILTPKDVLSADDYLIYQRRNGLGESYEKIANSLGGVLTRQAVQQRVKAIQKILKDRLDIEWDHNKKNEERREQRFGAESLLQALERFYKNEGRRASTTDLTSGDKRYPPLYAYNQVFTSLRQAYEILEQRGIFIPYEPKPQSTDHRRKYSAEDLKNLAKEVAVWARERKAKELEVDVDSLTLQVPSLDDMRNFKAELKASGSDREFPSVASYYKNYPDGWSGLALDLSREGYGTNMDMFNKKQVEYTNEDLYETLYRFMIATAEERARQERKRLKRMDKKADTSHIKALPHWPSFVEAQRAKLTPSAFTMRLRAEDRHWANFIRDAKEYVQKKYGEEYPDYRRL